MIYFVNDHKTGYALTGIISDSINKLLFTNNKVEPIEVKVRHYFNFWHDNVPDCKYVVFIRHPYEIITSGYYYHKICMESWAIDSDVSYYKGWEEQFTENDILRNLEIENLSIFSKDDLIKKLLHDTIFSIGNKTYREILNELSLIDGLKYEMLNVAKMTIMGMYRYPHYDKRNVFTVKFEDLINDFQNTMLSVFAFMEISDEDKIIDFMNRMDENIIKKMPHEKILENPHITNKESAPFRYREVWTPELYKLAEVTFPKDILSKFNYEK